LRKTPDVDALKKKDSRVGRSHLLGKKPDVPFMAEGPNWVRTTSVNCLPNAKKKPVHPREGKEVEEASKN